MLVDPRWVVWAEQQVAAGCKTPEMLELAGVELDTSRPWQTEDVTNLSRPAMGALALKMGMRSSGGRTFISRDSMEEESVNHSERPACDSALLP